MISSRYKKSAEPPRFSISTAVLSTQGRSTWRSGFDALIDQQIQPTLPRQDCLTCCDYPIFRPSLVDADFRSASKFLAVLSQRQHDPKRLVCREIGNGLPEYLERFVEPRSGGRVPDQILLGTTSLRRPRKNKETSTTTKVFSIASSK